MFIELEGLLLSHPSVSDAAVIGLDKDHTEIPRAYIVVAPGIRPSPDTANEIMKWMDSRVSHYKRLRGGIIFIDQIPKSATRKILRRVLKDTIKHEQAIDRPRL